MQADLLSALKHAHAEAYARDDHELMNIAARAISYATSGERDLARRLAEEHGLIDADPAH
ncbi:hypothetical protein ABXK61_16235 [Burkholderia sola]|uniref:hypothetical protein n=1 Tax=Burkholderia TaxID=32008 RepID=UPI001AE28424|nr:hypothetical protein [Burkholderia sp. AcTa6-5]MBP0714855.1 hypothetical protein [Burkholderia sp. AcTa6-5]